MRTLALTSRPLDPAFLTTLADYRGRIVSAIASLKGRPGWTPPILKTYRTIVDASLAFIDAAAKSRQVSTAALTACTRRMKPYVFASTDVAGRAQLDGLHALMGKWRAILGAGWARAPALSS